MFKINNYDDYYPVSYNTHYTLENNLHVLTKNVWS